ncbi:hypothetical protein IL306_004073 [Fusarium sp. DS 682]|nr:hypothetical protein IL306_004073 [Fusarium sp. DS 682]
MSFSVEEPPAFELVSRIRFEETRHTQKKEYGSEEAMAFANAVRESLHFHYNSNEMLFAASTVVSLLGACFVASAKEEASHIFFNVRHGWKHLNARSEPSLSECLGSIAHAGLSTLKVAEHNMDMIEESSEGTKEIVSTCMFGGKARLIHLTNHSLLEQMAEIMAATQKLPDPEQARVVYNRFTRLGRIPDACFVYVADTEKAIDEWLLPVLEFHTAVAMKVGTTEARAEAQRSAKLQSRIEKAAGKESESAGKAAKAMLAALDKVGTTFQKTNSHVPPSWEACAADVAKSFTQATPSIVALKLPAIIEGTNPSSATDGNESLLSPGLAGLTDPAYIEALLLAPFVEILHSLLNSGPNDSMDWIKLKEDAGQGLTWILTNLTEQDQVTSPGTSGPSIELKDALSNTISTAESIRDALPDYSEIPTEVIKDWQESIKRAKATVLKLETTAKSFPGSSATTTQLSDLKGNPPTTDEPIANAAMLEKLIISKHAMHTRIQTYEKAEEAARRAQNDAEAMRTRLREPPVEGQLLNKVNQLLTDLITCLLKVRLQVHKLKSFYSGVTAMIRVVMQEKARRLGWDSTRTATKNGILRSTEMDPEFLYTGTIQIKAYLQLLERAASRFNEMQDSYIKQGMRGVWNLSLCLTDPDQMCARQASVNESADYTMESIVQEMEEWNDHRFEDPHVKRVAGEIQELQEGDGPKLEPVFGSAMKAGADTITEYVEKHM